MQTGSETEIGTRSRVMESPVGPLRLVAEGGALIEVAFVDSAAGAAPATAADDPLLERAATQLREYFAGARETFDLPLAPRGTEFQRGVWNALLGIPYGGTISYGTLAGRLGNPNASRAVGLANGANPIAIVIPCHRVIGADGSLTGYGGGLDRKKTLLALESKLPLLAGTRPATA